MRLTLDQLEDIFFNRKAETTELGTFKIIIHIAEKEDGIELRQALARIRKQRYEVSVFVEKILQNSDIDDVDYVIELLSADIKECYMWALECMHMLQSWRAKTLMQIVIEKQKR